MVLVAFVISTTTKGAHMDTVSKEELVGLILQAHKEMDYLHEQIDYMHKLLIANGVYVDLQKLNVYQ